MIPLAKVLTDDGVPTPSWVQYLNQVEPEVVPGVISAGSFVPSAIAGSGFYLILTQNVTVANPTNLGARGTELTFEFQQDGTGGRTLAFGSMYKFPGGVVPVWVTTANAINLMRAYYNGTYMLCAGYTGFA